MCLRASPRWSKSDHANSLATGSPSNTLVTSTSSSSGVPASRSNRFTNWRSLSLSMVTSPDRGSGAPEPKRSRTLLADTPSTPDRTGLRRLKMYIGIRRST